jgi:hypothetical protein
MDMRKYSGSVFLKPEDLRDGPITVTITDVSEGKYDKPNLHFKDGSRLSINTTNNRVLVRAYGHDSDDWVGKQIELTVGEVEFQGKIQDSILVNPISPTIENKKSPKSDLDDDIPY